MFDFRKSHDSQKNSVAVSTPCQPDKRESICRRVSFDIKYLGMGKCIDKRKSDRRISDRFDLEEYERLCQKRLGPGWL